METPPQRRLLVDQVAEALRRGLGSARWVGELPGEMELCREFQVSRMTLRRAMEQLVREGWIESGGRGRHYRILRTADHSKESDNRTIRFLTPFRQTEMGSVLYDLTGSLSEMVSAAGYRVEIEPHPRVFERHQPEKLAQLDALPDTAAWVLCFSTAEIQRWFASCGRPAVVAGRVCESLPLSGIHPDHSAATRHAAGLLFSRGHREMAYLIANLTSVGERLASEAFVGEAQRLGARARIVSYDADPEPAGRAVRDLMMARPGITGYVCGDSHLAITVLCHLQAAGVRIPAQAGVISIGYDNALLRTYPTIAHYRTDGKLIGRRIGRMLLDRFRHGGGKIRTHAILPEFIGGGSVGLVGK